MKKNKVFLSILALGLLYGTSAVPECYCACINNEKTKVCENSWDANYVYCGVTYCTGDLDLPKESPFDEKALVDIIREFEEFVWKVDPDADKLDI